MFINLLLSKNIMENDEEMSAQELAIAAYNKVDALIMIPKKTDI